MRNTTWTGLLGLLALLAVTALALPAAAEDVPLVIPYSGYLELDGVAYTGEVQMRFRFYDDEENLLWGETYDEDDEVIPVVDGRFDVYLGALSSHLPPAVLQADALYLRIYFQEPGREDYTRLYPDQPIVPVPYALWSTESGPLTVHGDLTLGTTATIAGDIAAMASLDVDSTGFIDVGGTLSALSLSAVEIIEESGATASLAAVGSITVADEVVLDGGSLVTRSANAVLSYRDSGETAGIAVGTGQAVTITGTPSFDGRVYTTGAVTLTTGDVIADQWRLQDTEPIMLIDYMEWPGSSLDEDEYRFVPRSWTGDASAGQVSCTNYTCFVAGVKIWNDGLCTGSTSTCGSRELLEAYAYCGSTWWIRVTLNAGSPGDYDRQVAVACIPNDYL